MGKIDSDKKLNTIKIHIKNADVTIAGEITHYLFDMVDNRELHWISIDDVRKSEKSIEIILAAVAGFLATYAAGKVLDIPYERARKKIHSMLLKKKRKRRRTLDVFMDDDPIE